MNDQTIHLGDVKLQYLERGTPAGQNEGDLRLFVSVHQDTFTGSYDQIWIAKDDWLQFIHELAQLERTRTGQASLVSQSPDEFTLHLQITSAIGHLTAHGHLARHHFGHPAGKATRSRIEYHTPLDPSLLRDLLLTLQNMPATNIHS